MIEHLVELLRNARQRKRMCLNTVDGAAAENFLNGFESASFACGFDVPLAVRERATVERGWQWLAARPIEEMREQRIE